MEILNSVVTVGTNLVNGVVSVAISVVHVGTSIVGTIVK